MFVVLLSFVVAVEVVVPSGVASSPQLRVPPVGGRPQLRWSSPV